MKDFKRILKEHNAIKVIDYRILYEGLKNKPVETLDKECKLFFILAEWKSNDERGGILNE